jgi:hypothetical protein
MLRRFSLDFRRGYGTTRSPVGSRGRKQDAARNHYSRDRSVIAIFAACIIFYLTICPTATDFRKLLRMPLRAT